jgi:GGDEF domain-containing protein
MQNDSLATSHAPGLRGSRGSDESGSSRTQAGDTAEIKHKDKDAQIWALQARIAELEAALQAAHSDPQFEVLTRSGIDHRWHRRPTNADTVIFFDIDGVHGHNQQLGYAGTDAHIRAVMLQIDHFWLFRWFSGDEFGLLCAAPDAPGFAARVKRLLNDEGMTATFGIAPIINNDLEASMARAAALVQAAKARGMRGTINVE